MNNYKLYVHIAPNGKRYYGITKSEPKRRWQNGKGYKKNQHFTNAIEKYGWDNIEHIILFDSLTESEAKELEQYFIQWYDTANRDYGYNKSPGGESGNPSDETRKKLSDAKKGQTGYWLGKHHSDETKKKISENHADVSGENHPMHGKHHSDETKKKLSKPVMCVTTKRVFYGMSEAERQTGVKRSDISNCCRGKLKSAGKSPTGEKLIWKYIDIKEIV